MAANSKIYMNGINGMNGQYLIPPMDSSELARFIKNEPVDSSITGWLKRMWRTMSQPHLGLPFDVEPTDIKQTGWGIVFHVDEEDAVKEALGPLVEHRRREIGDDRRIKILEYRDGEDLFSWLARHWVGVGGLEPTKVPYYLLLVGSPEKIPFAFGHLLDMEYAVGRLHFDTSSEYVNYVTSLINYEMSSVVSNAKEAVFFATRHDRSTELSADLLVKPLATNSQQAPLNTPVYDGFRIRSILGEIATKEALSNILVSPGSTLPPSFLFTASHGIGLPQDHSQQHAVNGALLCQNWQGPGTISPDSYFTGSDIALNSRIHGMITFHFACYSAGTPSHDRFTHNSRVAPGRIANPPFIAALPKALLSHPQGGAIACIGHVERAWSYSFITPGAGPQLQPFRNAISRILKGEPVGHAMKDFNERYAFLSTDLSSLLENLHFDPTAVSDQTLVMRWIERNDAESYIVIGDPVARLSANKML
jgi:Peptidase family C25